MQKGKIMDLEKALIEKDSKIKQLERDIEDLKDYYENIIAIMPGHVYWLDKNNVYLGCNDLQAEHAGLNSRHEIVGKTNYDMLWKDQAENLNKLNLEVMMQGKPSVAEEDAVMTTGFGTYLSQKVPLRNKQNEVIGIIGISIDITDRKRAEEREKQALADAAEAERAKAEAERDLRQAVMVLTGSIVHDLRTPISMLESQGAAIQKYFPIMADAYLKAKANNLTIEGDQPDLEFKMQMLSQIGEAFKATARRMHEFITVTLKTLSKVLRGELTQEDLVPTSMWHCIHNTLTRYPFINDEDKLAHIDRKYDFNFMGNEVLMIRVLTNLLKNALEQIKKKGSGEIFIITEETPEANLLRFKDTAGGALPEVVAHLFDGYKTTKEGGTGVGLAFCKLTMKSFGGDITCNSVYGEYIEFVMSFPKIK